MLLFVFVRLSVFFPSFFCVFQVILAQMEVYEKSLKQAQRRLLRKAEWGEAVVPQPEVPQRTYNRDCVLTACYYNRFCLLQE